jgi:peptidoglycan-associated lipoprotein
MRFVTVIFALALTGGSAARAQVVPTDPTPFVPRYTIAFGYAALRANAPPAGCDCFGLSGGFVSGSVRVRDWLGVAGEFTGSHANDISLLGQNLTLMTVTAGPRISFPNHRVVPFGQVLIGFAHGSDSYFPTSTSFSTSASSFAFTTGGGIDIHLNHRIAVRAIEAQYLRTSLPNGTNNEENHLVLGAGIVFKFRGR